MKGLITAFFLFITMNTWGQKWSMDVAGDLQEDKQKLEILEGSLTAIEEARLTAYMGLNYQINNKWQARGGVSIIRFGNRTYIGPSQFSLNDQLSFQTRVGIPLGVSRSVFQKGVFDIRIRAQQVLLFHQKGSQTFGIDLQNENPVNTIMKTETVNTINTFSNFSQLGADFIFQVLPKTSVFFNIQYNQGWRPIFEKTVNYQYQGEEGSGVVSTTGTGW